MTSSLYDSREVKNNKKNIYERSKCDFFKFTDLWKNYIFLSLGETVTDDECQQFILDADQDGDGKINYEEFYNMMSQKLYWNAFKNLRNLLRMCYWYIV